MTNPNAEVVVNQALRLWGLEGAQTNLIAARENAVYRVTSKSGFVVMRLHRQGYRSHDELRSELEWMAALAAGGTKVPSPITSLSGNSLHVIDGVQVDVLSWLPGAPLDSYVANLTTAERTQAFFTLGKEMATLHKVSDAWIPSEQFTRCAWDLEGLLGDAPLWDCFWKNPSLSAEERQLFNTLRCRARRDLKRYENQLEYGLIHADLVGGNVLVSDDSMCLIDFDDGGMGFRLYEVVTALLKHSNDNDFIDLKSALIEGYQHIRPLELNAFDLFMALRAATYVGWNISRMNEAGGRNRNARFIDAARQHAKVYLEAS